MPKPRSLTIPNNLAFITVKEVVTADNCSRLDQALSNKQAIKRVFVILRQLLEGQNMRKRDWQKADVVVGSFCRLVVLAQYRQDCPQSQFAKLRFSLTLPKTDEA